MKLKDYEGNCDLCWKKSKRKKATIILERPELYEWWIRMEEKYSMVSPSLDAGPHYFHRDNTSTADLVKWATSTKFELAKDMHELNSMQMSMFDFDLDDERDCFCKSS